MPVLATAAVILAGASTSPVAVSRPLSWRPSTFLGDISYSMYLWHWPLIVVLPFITGVGLRSRDKLAIFVATVLLSWMCTRWVEDPMRATRFLAAVPWRAYVVGAGGMVVVLTMVGLLRADLDRDIREAESGSAGSIGRALAGNAPA